MLPNRPLLDRRQLQRAEERAQGPRRRRPKRVLVQRRMHRQGPPERRLHRERYQQDGVRHRELFDHEAWKAV